MANPPVSFSSLLENGPPRWPKSGDKLLVERARWEGGTVLADDPFARDSYIWSGYMSAGAALVDHCARDSVARFDLAYPILFNYRHGLEAAMKWVLDLYGQYAGLPIYKRDHDLRELWTKCRNVIETLSGRGGVEALEAVEALVNEFHDLDPGSLSFRYSRERDQTSIPLPVFGFDLENIRDVMEGVNNFFVGVDGELTAITGT